MTTKHVTDPQAALAIGTGSHERSARTKLTTHVRNGCFRCTKMLDLALCPIFFPSTGTNPRPYGCESGEFSEIRRKVRLQRERWWRATGRRLTGFNREDLRINERNECNRCLFGLDQNDGAIEHRAGSAHPGAQQGPMRGRMMLSVVLGMLGRLRLGQAADRQQCEDQKNREDFANRNTHLGHRTRI